MAKILVWSLKLQRPDLSQSGIEGKALSAIRNIGHSAILCDRVAAPAAIATVDPRYISYWPDAPVGLKQSSATGYRTPSYADDLAAEGGDPDEVFDLPCLDDAMMVQWWSAFLDQRSFIGPYSLAYWPKDAHYDLWRTNCSTIVALAMKIGGSDQFSRIAAQSVDTPGKVSSYARDIAFHAAVQGFFKRVGQAVFGG